MKQDKEKGEKDMAGAGPEGVAESVLVGVGNLIPGLGGIIGVLKKSDAFRERLALIDEEVERRLQETPLKQADAEAPGTFMRSRNRPPSGIPPSVVRRGRGTKKRFDAFAAGHKPMDELKRNVFVDIFEEKKKMRVIAELPGVDEEDIRLDLNGDTLSMSASRGNQNFYRDVELPRASENIIGKIYNNGILEVTLS